MLVAAYVVGGFLIASVYAIGMLRGRQRSLPPARLHHPVHRRRDHDADPDGRSATRWRAGSTTTSRPSSPRSSWCRRRASDVPETLFGHLNSNGTGERRHPDPRAGVDALRSGTGKNTIVEGRKRTRRSARADRREPVSNGPTIAEANVVHLAWDVMVGLGTLLFLLSVWYGAVAGCSSATAEDEVVPPHRRVCRRAVGASRWKPAGSSPRSVANRGSCTTT